MQNVFIYFWRRSHRDPDKKAAVACRITVNRIRTEFMTDVKIENRLWDQASQKIKGSSDEARIGNRSLAQLRNRIGDIVSDFRKDNRTISAELIKVELTGHSEITTKNGILSLAHQGHIKKAALVDTDYAKNTVTRYKQSLNSLEFFIQKILGKDDIPIALIDYNFIKKYEEWGNASGVFHGHKKRKWKTNYLAAELTYLKNITNEAFKMGLISSSPFVNYKIKKEAPTFKYLTIEEVEALDKMTFKESDFLLEETRDIFVFCCYTGLAYIDVYELSKDFIVHSSEFGLCINKDRSKSKIEAFIPILDKPKKIIDKYKEKMLDSAKILPVPPYTTYRVRLIELSKMADLRKGLKSHIARHTAATYFLNNNIPEEIVCRALGLSSTIILRSTYGKLLNTTVAKHFMKLRAPSTL